jgi:tripartite-type tricarboxylate transporter receptor subunit TctC
LGFDPNRDFVPVATVASSELFLATGPEQPFKTVPEFIEHAKKARPPLAYGSNGMGGQHHLTMEMFKAHAGIDLLHVPYKGATPAATAAIRGEVAALFSGGAAGPLIRNGRLRALAVAGRKRVAAFPEVPTVGEFLPGFANSVWLGLCAPKLTPEPVLTRLRAEINKSLALADVKEKFNRAGGLEPLITTPGEFAEMIRDDYEKYGKLVKDLGLRVD